MATAHHRAEGEVMVVFMDHMMPQMDGIETLEQLRKDGLLRENMKVIALTANAVVGAQDYYLKAGFDDYLSKPIETVQLERMFKKYLPSETLKKQDENVRQIQFGQMLAEGKGMCRKYFRRIMKTERQ